MFTPEQVKDAARKGGADWADAYIMDYGHAMSLSFKAGEIHHGIIRNITTFNPDRITKEVEAIVALKDNLAEYHRRFPRLPSYEEFRAMDLELEQATASLPEPD